MSANALRLARQWATNLPGPFSHQLADALRQGPDAVRALPATLPASTAARHQAIAVAEAGDGAFAGGALAAFLDARASQPTVTAVWTGPDSTHMDGRLTLAVLADLIGEAQHELLLVSYATYPSSEVRGALHDAAARGVQITTLLERPADNPHFHGADHPFADLPARHLVWPAHHREPGAALHAKVLVVDRRTALVGSANLTDYGLERNLECGLLIRGGPVPSIIAAHLYGVAAFVKVPS